MTKQKDKIVNCAKRLTDKLRKSPYNKYNGEYPKDVQKEIERMINHCKEKNDENS